MELTIEQALQQAVRAHKEGKLQDAERLYRSILQSQPLHPGANHNLGVLTVSANKADAALPLFKTAVEANPKVEQFWLSYIDTLIREKQFNHAKQVLGEAKKQGVAGEKIIILEAQLASINKQENVTRLSPSQAQLSNLLAHYQTGRYGDAEKLAITITEEFPEHPFGWKVLGAVLKKTGRISESLAPLQKTAELEPHDFKAHYNLGNTLRELGRLDEAAASFVQAIAVKPDFAEAHYNLGNIFKELGRLDEAEASYKQVIALKPDYAEAHNNLGITLKETGRLAEAEASVKQAIALKTDFAEAYNNQGNVFKELGRLDEAEASLKQATALKSDFTEAHNNLGITLQELGRLDEAEASYTRAIALEPDYPDAHLNLAMTLNAMGSRERALEHFDRTLQLRRGTIPVDPQHKSFSTTSNAKLDHDIEQFEYLAASGHDTEKFQELAALYKTVKSEINHPLDTDLILLSDKHQSLLADTYNRPIHILDAPVLDKPAINDSLDVEKITEDYFGHEFGLTYVDEFLSPAALVSLREFLLGSTIWFDCFHEGGYIGADLSEGLASPLVLQIAEDLRNKLPRIFKNHQLTQFWAFKYDSRASKKNNTFGGIDIHADFAAVNVNFWITPNSANLDTSSGGLVVYNAEAPLEWDFNTYNNNDEKIREEILKSDRKVTVIPYNENRAVIFNSNLFHKTDNIDFKEGYENRRINVTMLFGRREL